RGHVGAVDEDVEEGGGRQPRGRRGGGAHPPLRDGFGGGLARALREEDLEASHHGFAIDPRNGGGIGRRFRAGRAGIGQRAVVVHRLAWPAAGAALALASAAWMWGFTVDDALIPVRYARHLAAGQGWRFNLGGPATDGVTPLPWPLLLAPFARAPAL